MKYSPLAKWLARELTGRVPQEGPKSWFDAVSELVRKSGSVSAAARDAGLPRRTVRDWVDSIRKAGEGGRRPVQPRPGNREKVHQALRDHQIGDASDSFSMEVQYRSEDRDRTLSPNNLDLRAGTMQAAADRYVETGDWEAAAARFLAGVGEDWYRGALKPHPDDLDDDFGWYDHIDDADAGPDYGMDPK